MYQEFCPVAMPVAVAKIEGGPLCPSISGQVVFYAVPEGTVVCVNLIGLPPYQPAIGTLDPIGPHGFHVHEFGSCVVGNPASPFEAAGGHWNPTQQPHGNHAGDFPVLFSNGGKAKMCFFTDKFQAEEVIGRTVIIHENPDDYRSQPAGDAGRRLACGVIQPYGNRCPRCGESCY